MSKNKKRLTSQIRNASRKVRCYVKQGKVHCMKRKLKTLTDIEVSEVYTGKSGIGIFS